MENKGEGVCVVSEAGGSLGTTRQMRWMVDGWVRNIFPDVDISLGIREADDDDWLESRTNGCQGQDQDVERLRLKLKLKKEKKNVESMYV